MPKKRASKPKPGMAQFVPNTPMLTYTQGNQFEKEIDPLHTVVDLFSQPLVRDIWEDKYRWEPTDKFPSATFERVARAIYANDPSHAQEAMDAMCAGLWMPGGRIIAGAGTSKRVTLMNCYVAAKIEDSLDAIMGVLSDAALTQQQGGGIGMDFSTIRPSGAILQRTGATASGPLPFMDMWNSMCATIMSAGDRRGAMMGTICDTHPDLPRFITAKQTKDRLTNFNVSVLVSDAFMEAVREDEDWVLHFNVRPQSRETSLEEYDFFDDQNTPQFAYQVIKARELWDLILKNTYDYSEPGIIFIDRINGLNNLKYCEEIHCTNPCGEQPLPPNGTCNLGAINLSRFVLDPFSESPVFNWTLLSRIAKLGLRFLDNVIDQTNYPLQAQADEELKKRRTGLGVSGLADCLAQMNLRYGSAAAIQLTERIFQTICLAAYEESATLAEERGPFPLFDCNKFFEDTFAKQMLPQDLRVRIASTGIRNGVLLTVAPTGTTSILFGNISSGIEPVFAHRSTRKVRQADGSWKSYDSYGYNMLLYAAYLSRRKGEPISTGDFETPQAMVTAEDLSIEDHIATQAAVQRWVDASVSKTINVPEKTTYEQFCKVYDLAYTLGCKGCTTYRPSEVRGSILSRTQALPVPGDLPKTVLAQRPEVLQGITHKVKWPSMSSALYVTVNRDDTGNPFEVFFHSKDARSQEWMTALSLMISAILRKGDGGFISAELGAVHSIHDTAWIRVSPSDEKPKFFGSLIAYIGYILGQDFNAPSKTYVTSPSEVRQLQSQMSTERCPQCFAPSLVHLEGCTSCTNCGYSNCA